jgi:hypothetical protein
MNHIYVFAVVFGFFAMTVDVLPVQAQDANLITRLNIDLMENGKGEWRDYLIQNVCVDANNRAIPGDPKICLQHRNVLIGEKVPYLISDYDRVNGQRYQAMFSYPVPGRDGSLMVMHSKIFGFTNGVAPFRFKYDGVNDGFDLTSTKDDVMSFTRTFDGGCGDQLFENGKGQREGGWYLFSKTLTGGDIRGHSTVIRRISRGFKCPPLSQSLNSVLAEWEAPQTTTFEAGVRLRAIKLSHVADMKLNNPHNSMERFYFTREYGFTRWEAWETETECQRQAALGGRMPNICSPENPTQFLYGRCESGGTLPARENRNGIAWVRIDCRDWTNYLPLSVPIIPLHEQMGTQNGVQDILPYVDQPGVVDAVLQIPQGSWGKSCQNTSLSYGLMTTLCRAKDGRLVQNNVDLRKCFSEAHNIDGQLICNGGGRLTAST